MPTLYTLEASQISVSGGESLSGITQGDGSHLVGETITLNSNAWQTVDIVDNDNYFADNDGSQRLDGALTYDGVNYNSGLRIEAEYQIVVQDPDGNTYTVIGMNIREPGGNNSYGTIEGLAFIGPEAGFPPSGVPLTVISTSEGPSNSETSYDDYATPPCFTPQTMIETVYGPEAIENIRVGDLVETLDNGLQPLRWVGTVGFSKTELQFQPSLVPVLIRKGALGGGLPVKDLLVSPQHRVLISDWRAQIYFGEEEVLVAAKHLVDDVEIVRHIPEDGVTYIHILFDRHEVVFAEKQPTESFLPGEKVCNGFSKQVQQELLTIFPTFNGGWDAFKSKRMSIKSHQALPLAA